MLEHLKMLRSSEELESIVPQWSNLWRTHSSATPFQSPEWLVPWWHCFGEELRTVITYRDGELIGLLPFYVHREPETGERRLLPLGVGTSDYLDGVFAHDCSVQTIQSALEFLCEASDWDALHVSQLRPESKLLIALRRSARLGDSVISTQDCSRMEALPLPNLPPKIRRNAMYYRNRAQRAGILTFNISDESTSAEQFEALHRLSTERWRSRGQAGVFADDRVIRWHREATPLLAVAQLLRLYSLRLDDDIIGVLYSFVDPPDRPGRTQYFYLPAFSLRYADLRPGTVLTALAIDHAASEGVRTIDMLRGEEEYKKLWHTERTQTFGFIRPRHTVSHQENCNGEIAA